MPPLPILEIREKSFEINAANFNSVLDKVPDLPIVVLSINGVMREGKSYIHSYFIRYLKEQGKKGWFTSVLENHEMFSWKSGSTRETVGINIWSEPYVTKQNGRDVAVLLLDCQGLFDPQTTYAQNAAIYAFSSLLSSVMIYNVKTKIQEDLLQKILLFSEYAASISSQDPDHEDTRPYFMFLIRDFEFVEEFDFGFHNKDNCPKRDLDNPQNYFRKIFTDTEEIHEKNRAVRMAIQKAYNDIGMFVMPHPGDDFILNSIKNSPDEEFQELLEELVVHVMTNLVTKKIGSDEISGKKFKEYVKLWADLCKKSDFPVAQTVAEMSTRLQNDQALAMALETFKMNYSNILGLPDAGMEEAAFRKTYPPELEKAIKVYKTSRSLGDEDMVADYIEKLTKVCDAHFQAHCMTINETIRKIKLEKLSKEEEIKKLQDVDNRLDYLQSTVRIVESVTSVINKGMDLVALYKKQESKRRSRRK